MVYIRFARNDKSANCSSASRSWLANRSYQIYEKCSILAVWVLFPKVSVQAKKWLKLELHEIIKVSHIFACSVVFILLCCLGRHGGVLKPKRVVSFSNFCGLVFVPEVFYDILRRWLYYILLIPSIWYLYSRSQMSMIFASKQECFTLLKMVLF